MDLCHHGQVRSPSTQQDSGDILSSSEYSYAWTIPSILGDLCLSWTPTVVIFILAFSPLLIAFGIVFGIGALAFLAAKMLWKALVWLYPYVSPPFKWLLWYLSWPLRISWFALKGVVPLVRFIARTRRKWILIEDEESSAEVSLDDLEKGHGRRHISSPGSSLLRMVVGLRKSSKVPHPNDFSLEILDPIPTQQPRQAGGGAEASSEPLLNAAPPTAPICGHSNDWHCRTCGNQTCFQCSVEISDSPSTTPHFFCEPRCSRCYLNTMCGGVFSPTPTAKKQKNQKRNLNPCTHRQNRCKSLPKPRICKQCAANENTSTDVLLRVIVEQERKELIHLARENLKCGVCEKRLRPKGGPRWWVCCDCNEECGSGVHPSWSWGLG